MSLSLHLVNDYSQLSSSGFLCLLLCIACNILTVHVVFLHSWYHQEWRSFKHSTQWGVNILRQYLIIKMMDVCSSFLELCYLLLVAMVIRPLGLGHFVATDLVGRRQLQRWKRTQQKAMADPHTKWPSREQEVRDNHTGKRKKERDREGRRCKYTTPTPSIIVIIEGIFYTTSISLVPSLIIISE